MNCGCCCTNTLNFCNANICDGEIDFDIKAQIAGIHKFVTEFLGFQITIENEFEIGDEIIFPIDELNESYQFTGQLFDPNGAKILIRKDTIDYDCFKFRIILGVTLNKVNVIES